MLNRRLMMAYAATPKRNLVQDGLKLNLDAFNRGGVAGTWKDLASGLKFTMKDVVENPHFVRFKTSSNVYTTGTYNFGSNWTVQFVIRPTSQKAMIISNAESSRPINVGFQSGKDFWLSSIYDPGYATSDLLDGKIHTFSMSLALGYEDKKPMARNGRDGWGGPSTGGISIGRRGYHGTEFSGDIYAVRVYNRELTEEEILQNQQYDIDTYFGG